VANDPEFAAKMTNIQFCALAQYLNEARIVSTAAPLACAKSPACDLAIARRWIRNAWNTEKVLRLNLDNFAPEELNACVHWALPQAYLNFFATGTIQNMNIVGVQRAAGGQTIDYDKNDQASIENQIAQFLSASRKERLKFIKERNFRNTFKTKRGKKLKNFKEPQWEKVAETAGPTSLLSLLYRKRITANYDDIATITSDHLDGQKLISDLLVIVRSCNLIHEHLIFTALGNADFESLHANDQKFEFVLDSRQKLDAV